MQRGRGKRSVELVRDEPKGRLIISRKEMEAILLSGGIRVTVIKINGSSVKLAIQAPPEVDVLREELVRTRSTQ